MKISSRLSRKLLFLPIASFFLLVAGCRKGADMMWEPGTKGGPNSAYRFYALTMSNELHLISTASPANIEQSIQITGLQPGEKIFGIDFRPATGQLYALGSSSRLYVIQLPSGKAMPVGSGPFSPKLAGEVAGFDFNPTVDRIRVVTGSGQNLRLHPETGSVVAVDGAINGAPNASIHAVAYTNNVAGATNTILYDIDMANGKLFKQIPPNDGRLQLVGDLRVKPTGEGGFDISPDNSMALAAFQVNGRTGLYRIDLQSGRANPLGALGRGMGYTGIAIPTNPVAYAIDPMNRLIIFNPMTGDTAVRNTNLPVGEKILGIDFRPANGQLYALSSASKLYTINTSNGMAAQVGSGTFSTPLAGDHFGFDFNPVVDRIRVVSDAGQNLRLHPETGALVAVDGNLNPGMPRVSAAAYTNNLAGATSTELLVIDGLAGMLYLQDPPNPGGLVPRGSLGFMPSQMNGFDIGGASNMAFGLFEVGGITSVYTVNLMNGMATRRAGFKGKAVAMAVGLGF